MFEIMKNILGRLHFLLILRNLLECPMWCFIFKEEIIDELLLKALKILNNFSSLIYIFPF